MNGVKDFGGNRSLGTMFILTFLVIMILGLLKLPKYFTIVSTLNFSVGMIMVGLLIFSGLPNFNVFLITLFYLGLVGFIISIRAVKSH